MAYKIIPFDGIITSITALQRKLALFTALPSQYGWGFGKTANSSPYFFENEYFAEAFTYWFLTPDIQKNYYWELINDTFMEILADIRVYEV
ncbi:hypothetical protein [Spiroplasma endosymbiont of Nephrotoma flavescens]|uniref:hypothetical protein n=1 Tax=Spiroplasma endosymbiont of Nephrotoma flavescens TaxID=3066302 RepID=UPI00313A92D1